MDRHAYIDERLAEIPMFAKLDKKQLREISTLATQLQFPAGKELTRQGEFGNEFVLLLDGEVEVRVDDETVATLGAGDYFGEIALLEDVPRTATVVATTPVTAEVIGRREFSTLINDMPGVAAELRAAAERHHSES